MILVELFVMQAGNRDESIRISRVPGTNEVYSIHYTPREGKKSSYTFQFHRSKVTDYIYDMLDLLRYDVYPYDSIQVMTKHMPPVVVSVMDLEDDSARSLIGRTILAGLDANVSKRTLA